MKRIMYSTTSWEFTLDDLDRWLVLVKSLIGEHNLCVKLSFFIFFGSRKIRKCSHVKESLTCERDRCRSCILGLLTDCENICFW